MDDGNHTNRAIISTFNSFHSHLAEEFVYFIEDNSKVHKYFKTKYPMYNVKYENQMTIISNVH